MTVNRFFFILVLLHAAASLTGCMEWNYDLPDEDLSLTGRGLFIVNEGNFQYGNATLSYYEPAGNTVENEVFVRANGMKLGDVAQSMTIWGGRGWIVVNNSHVVFAIDPETGREVGRITNLTSPRYIHFVSPDKAYISQLWDNRLTVVNPTDYSITGYIEVPGMDMQTGSTEQMVQYGDYVFCTCWSYQNRIIRIDTRTDRVDAFLTVGLQPSSLVIDRYNRLWAITDGGYDGSPYGHEAPALWCIDAATFTVERIFEMAEDAEPVDLQTDADGTALYWNDGGVMRMDVDAAALPTSPIIPSRGTRYYGLTVSPYDGDIYVADAIDYQQQGLMYRYSVDGILKESFYVGVNPTAFCWK